MMARPELPEWLDPTPWLDMARGARTRDVDHALQSESPTERELAALLSPAAANSLERLAQRAKTLTRRHFGRTIKLYAPLYLSSYCTGGCVYCGFASDTGVPRHRLTPAQVESELAALCEMGIDEVILLTGERTEEVGFDYVHACVAAASRHMSQVTVEVFPMETDEYRRLARAGCTGVTLYQETYDPVQYHGLHRWGPKQDYAARLDAPGRVLAGGVRTIGLGALLGLAEPVGELISLFRHVVRLRRRFWRAGISISFPRIRKQVRNFTPAYQVTERQLAQFVFAFRICLPRFPLVLSTRESAPFRDGMAGVGVSKMSVASRTTVGGYSAGVRHREGQFETSDTRDVTSFCSMLRSKGLEPVFKNWEPAYRGPVEEARPARGDCGGLRGQAPSARAEGDA